MHFYVNRPNLSFENVQDVLPQYSLEHVEAKHLEEDENDKGLPIPKQILSLRFNKVSTLTIFVEASAGGNCTSMGSLRVWGRPTTVLAIK